MADATPVFPGPEWVYGQPGHGVFDPGQLRTAVKRGRRRGAAVLMVVEGGRVVASDGDLTAKLELASGRKSLLGALYGIYIGEGVIDPASSLADLGVDDLDPLTEEEKRATIRDLLMSRSGVYRPAAKETLRMKLQRPRRGSHRPGERWYYNNWDFNVLGTIFEQLVGMTVHEAFAERIAGPIGMQDFTPSDGYYISTKHSKHPAYRFTMSTRDLARFALLYARQGRWRDRQVVPAEWVTDTTTPHTRDAQGGLGFGYSWWVGRPQDLDGHEFHAIRGGIGHAALIVPSLDVIVVHRVRVSSLAQKLGVPFLTGWLYWTRVGPRARRHLPPTTLNGVMQAVAAEPVRHADDVPREL